MCFLDTPIARSRIEDAVKAAGVVLPAPWPTSEDLAFMDSRFSESTLDNIAEFFGERNCLYLGMLIDLDIYASAGIPGLSQAMRCRPDLDPVDIFDAFLVVCIYLE